MTSCLFVTGTDTGVGKTQVACGLLAQARQRGWRTAAIKPLASGCLPTAEGLRNADALALQQQSGLAMGYEEVNPIAIEPAVAPHIGLEQEGRKVRPRQLADHCRGYLERDLDLVVVEGAGGWRVPLSGEALYSEVPRLLQASVLLVVGMQLGCINHALLTAQAIRQDGLNLVGWVANCATGTMPEFDANMATLKSWLPAPCWGQVPCMDSPSAEAVAGHLVAVPASLVASGSQPISPDDSRLPG